MRIGIDIDGTVCNIYDPWFALYNQDHNDTFTIDQCLTWGIAQYCKGNKELYAYRTPEAYSRAMPYKGVGKALDALKAAGHTLIAITHDSERYRPAKQVWLEKHCPQIEELVIVPEKTSKSTIEAHVLIDDAIHNVAEFSSGAILMDRPWNRRHRDGSEVRFKHLIGRAYDWQAIPEFIALIHAWREEKEKTLTLWRGMERHLEGAFNDTDQKSTV